MCTLIDIQEASKANSERQVSENWRTIKRLTEIIQELQNHLDGHRLSQDDVAGIFLEKEISQSQVQDLKHSLADIQTTSEAVTRRLMSRLATCQDAIRLKGERITELERACIRITQDV